MYVMDLEQSTRKHFSAGYTQLCKASRRKIYSYLGYETFRRLFTSFKWLIIVKRLRKGSVQGLHGSKLIWKKLKTLAVVERKVNN